MPVDAIANVVTGGLLTGLVYGLMALGLSVIYGVVRIVNFAHGELMAHGDVRGGRRCSPRSGSIRCWMLLPVAVAFFGLRLRAAARR